MQEFRVTFTGGRTPLVLHNVRLASPFDKHAKALKRLNAKRGKTEDDHLAIARVEWEGGLYWDDEIGAYLPVKYPYRVMHESAKITRDGERYKRSVVCMAEDGGARIPLAFDKPDDWPDEGDDALEPEDALSAMWEDDRFSDMSMVSVSRSKVLRTRPRFENWSISFLAVVEESVMDLDVFTEIAQRAGRLIGMGEAPEGIRSRFDVEVEVLDGSEGRVAA